MSADAVRRLEELARTDPTVAPLARLQVELLRATADGSWERNLPSSATGRLADGLPLLHARTLRVDVERVRDLLARLAGLATGGRDGASPFSRFLAGAEAPLDILRASIVQDTERMEEIAMAAGIDAGVLTAIAGLATQPLLQACGRKVAPLLDGLRWDAGHCPVCAAWPLLAELRGLERRRWLRCGRCGAGWVLDGPRCVFCGNSKHRTLAYLAPEAARESRLAATCDGCAGYLKTFTTLGSLAPEDVTLQDLTSLELDMAALEAGYARPEAPGFPLDLRLEPAEESRRTGWLRRK